MNNRVLPVSVPGFYRMNIVSPSKPFFFNLGLFKGYNERNDNSALRLTIIVLDYWYVK